MDEPTEVSQHPGWTLNIALTITDIMLFDRAVWGYKAAARLVPRILLAGSVVFAVVAMEKLEYTSRYDTKVIGFTLLIAYAIYRLLWLFYDRIYYMNLYPEDSERLAPYEIRITKDGVSAEGKFSSSTVRWPGVKDILCQERAVYLVTKAGTGLILPYRFLPAGVTPKEFIRVLRSFKECART